MIGWLGSCHPAMNALKLDILNTCKGGAYIMGCKCNED